jgi:hypothetical protein
MESEATMEKVSELDDVGLLVRLDSVDPAAQAPESLKALIKEAKGRGIVVSLPPAEHPNSPWGRMEFTLSCLPTQDLRAISEQVTRSSHKSCMGLHDAVLKEFEERTPTKAEGGDRIYLSAGTWVRIDSVESGAVLYSVNKAPKAVPIQNIEPASDHGRGCWTVSII